MPDKFDAPQSAAEFDTMHPSTWRDDGWECSRDLSDRHDWRSGTNGQFLPLATGSFPGVQSPHRGAGWPPVHYERDHPEQTTLYRLVQQHAATFFAETDDVAEPIRRTF